MKIYVEFVIIMIIIFIIFAWWIWFTISKKKALQEYNINDDKSRIGEERRNRETRKIDISSPRSSQPPKRDILETTSINILGENESCSGESP